MKFWRTTSVVALAVAFSAGTAFAALAPKAPAAATGAASGGCIKSTDKAPIQGLAMCAEMTDSTSAGVGNGFPWENSTFFFSTFRNQYLWPSASVKDTAKITCTIESLQARSVSFTGANTNNYGQFLNGDDSFLRVTDAVADTLVPTFALNTGGNTYCEVTSTDTGGQITIATATGPNGALSSTCTNCPMGDSWCNIGDITPAAGLTNLMQDHSVSVGTGNSGAGVWDTSANGPCGNPGSRAFGSGSFANSQHLTTALGVDSFDMVWVFKGTAPPPPMTVEQQIAEIVRLLLTPEGLRCSSLDTSPGDDRISDEPVAFPNGKSFDPISPQVSNGGTVTGDELIDDLRKPGWL
jgi:hypothetical protein